MGYYIYMNSPIDWWDGWMPAKDFFGAADADSHALAVYKDGRCCIPKFFKEAGWEGDGFWHVAGFPDGECGPSVIWAVKQSNNGSVFLASPLELTHLRSNFCFYSIPCSEDLPDRMSLVRQATWKVCR